MGNDNWGFSGQVSPETIYEAVTKAFAGIITVIDRDGIVVYTQNLPKRNRFFSDQWIDLSLQKQLDMGVIASSPSLTALKSKRFEMSFLGGGGKFPLVSFANPVFDENGDIQYVVAYNLPEDLIHSFSDAISTERNRAKQLIDFMAPGKSKSSFLLSENAQIQDLLSILARISNTDMSIMFTGETGVGKEVFSRYVHSMSTRSKEVFVPVNCSAIPPELMESEFFGYDRGAFTGANKEGKIGLFELANKGTLFLDEVGELSVSMQPKLLRVLESGEYRKVGGTKTCKTDVRIISATNRDLRQMVKDHTFREDLYYRLNVIPIRIPSLRERKDDIIPLAKFFLNELNKKYKTFKVFHQGTLDALVSYSWPGNVRELSNTVEQLYITATSDQIFVHNGFGLGYTAAMEQNAENDGTVSLSAGTSLPLKDTMRRFEEQYIRSVLESCGGKVALAAERLQITKAGLYKKLESYKKASGGAE